MTTLFLLVILEIFPEATLKISYVCMYQPALRHSNTKAILNCLRAAQLPLFCDHDLEMNHVTLKVEGKLDILKNSTVKMKLLADGIQNSRACIKNNTEIYRGQRSNALPITSSIHQGAYSYQVTSISDQ